MTQPRTWRKALLQLVAIQAWMRAGMDKAGRPYGPRFFRQHWYRTLFASNRRVVVRLIRSWRCVYCGASLPEDSTGDHLIPRAAGGIDEVVNFLPLCRSCNASKGVRDFMAWWHSKGRTLEEAGPDVICSYARLMFHYLRERGQLDEEAPDYLVALIEGFMVKLPQAHREAVRVIGDKEVVSH